MRQRLSLVTLGVRDKQRALKFYEALGWAGTGGSGDEPVFFQAGDMVVALWDRASLAEDSCVEDTGGWGGITLAHCVASREEVDAITEVARGAGARIGREPAETFWGGYTSIVIDPDGHPWEIAHNPGWTLTPDGAVLLS
jgi:catechol 2,3-dioxygenase-like lactoylglutathione lyase family enzyme